MEPILARSVRIDDDGVHILDRRRFPFERVWLRCATAADVAKAITDMVTQSSGPYFAALQAMVLSARAAAGLPDPRAAMAADAAMIVAARPTNDHLAKAVAFVMDAYDPDDVVGAAERGAARGDAAYRDRSRALGEHTAALLADGARVLTHCWADLYLTETVAAAQRAGKALSFVCTETRPYLQGARLTAESLAEMGVDTTLITDGMGASVLAEHRVDVLLTAADRVAMDGSVVNKVGTLGLAVAAHAFGVPYLALVQTPDRTARTGADIPIEHRDGDDVLHTLGARTASTRVRGHYPAFDVTPPRFVTTVVTDRGPFAPDALNRYWEGRE
ncbi:methylthioribose-1-phosphate isomerase [Actinokineospora soli]|uniref:Methylthioribose-1-phosphate isomerase n=1 Tax=Actinokineospora soli TaxID=1048753 RepID=A0ABW2TMQ4_9PSEU